MVTWTSVGGVVTSTLVKTPVKKKSPPPPGDLSVSAGGGDFLYHVHQCYTGNCSSHEESNLKARVVTSFTTFTPARIQSDDLKVNSHALYQLSYTGNNNAIVEIPRDMYWYLYDFSLF
jgi:hypothetical protein